MMGRSTIGDAFGEWLYLRRVQEIADKHRRGFSSEVEVAEPPAPAETPTEHREEVARERAARPDVDKENRTGRKPPKEGPCKRCGLDRPLNRLMLCYRCWVITRLEEDAKARGEVWTEGMPHPEACSCEGLGEHKNADGTARGLN